ncbi:MAG TPA: L-threonylcarbamoyladenylate synthase [Acidobacteriaceae bacterium]|jgi:L-threonylcarbamoyladenylate synthase|nr:L-threonylcarbamoyladenylate synthase [Acidobacteriaceae bacterium]
MLKTLHLNANDAADVEWAASLLRAGRLVAFATETVYGLGANALSAEAVAGIFQAKQRPRWDPLIVHVAAYEEIGSVAVLNAALRARVERLAAAFWPGPLTMLLPRTAAVPAEVTAGRSLVGVRVPSHPAAQALLRAARVPVAAPSANLFGHTSPTTAEHVLADLDGRIDAVLDAGATQVGVESTVVDVTQTPMVVYRPGAVSTQQLEEVCGVRVELFVPAVEDERREPESLPSPGVGMRHYAPRARVLLVKGEVAAIEDAVRGAKDAERVGVLLPEGWSVNGGADGRTEDGVVVWRWGRWDRPQELAAGLYAGMRMLDARDVEVIVCPLPAEGALNDAIRDRLLKAARSA